MSRIDDAARGILRLKEHRELDTEAVRKSLVLFKNGATILNAIKEPRLIQAQMLSSKKILTLTLSRSETINNVCGNIKCVVVVISDCPLVTEPYVSTVDALVVAWLLGSEGKGMSDVLFGDYPFTGELARTWFERVDQLPMNVGDPHYDPLFPFGFALFVGNHPPPCHSTHRCALLKTPKFPNPDSFPNTA
ncbi:hypothetical protein Pint_05741 [Pistacia integerrima]|uniref:Uncharacterized protein n=1 Tax=Pistacia integerrima TaxID=434235 RepID=A0ACC0Z6U9_9ROSI|nr:hypothetical protein Pint_05741 [Pistacia integerrima]